MANSNCIAGVALERLSRIGTHLQSAYIDAGKLPGALTLVARRGQVVYYPALEQAESRQNVLVRSPTLILAC